MNLATAQRFKITKKTLQLAGAIIQMEVDSFTLFARKGTWSELK
jgi:hypothetical protein